MMAVKPILQNLPLEIFEKIALQARVNDQICLALTCKQLYTDISTITSLQCNSAKDSVRYEAWRFGWLGYTKPDTIRDSFDDQDVRTLGLGDQLKIRQHLKRCKRSSSANLRGRISKDGLSTRSSSVCTVADVVRAERTRPTRTAAHKAVVSIRKFYRK